MEKRPSLVVFSAVDDLCQVPRPNWRSIPIKEKIWQYPLMNCILPDCLTESNVIMRKPLLKLPVPTPLRQQVVDILRDAITDHLFEPGGRLKERELCELLNVSRSTIREGLRQLEAEGLVQITPNKGPMVTDLDESEARNIYAIRARLQAMAGEICARNPTPQVISELETHLSEMKLARSEDDYPRLHAARTHFYNLIFDATENDYLAMLLRQLRARVTIMRGQEGLRELRMKEAIQGASRILSAIKARDTKRAAIVAEEHIYRAAELVFRARKEELGNSGPTKRRRGRPAKNVSA